ncbi:hypothetical protein H6F98_00910 [Microcoleus sp. FACHB-SPT15]|uniref:MAG6450 family protein n=1 Tax=Microcoleus sp. FACHB-SPT15 TaxID=2692830 RepID=UPI0017814429|nr:hypothetical protein [Microcoleus sp. FACHB-SPT15]MBD1804034.1 hypothetical protein [Microcoleus sp. FACHB-SPT15]
MGKKNKIPKPSVPTNSGRIPDLATTKTTKSGSTDSEKPSFSFIHADNNKYQLSEWESREIDDLVKALKKIGSLTWFQIKSQGSRQRGESVGCGFKIVTDGYPKLPESISEDVTMSEMRVCKKKRIFGFRIPSSPIYCLVWFDRDHNVCRE